MQEVKFLTDATTAEIARLARSMHEQDMMSVKEEKWNKMSLTNLSQLTLIEE